MHQQLWRHKCFLVLGLPMSFAANVDITHAAIAIHKAFCDGMQADTSSTFDASSITSIPSDGSSNGVIATSTSTPGGQSGEIASWGPGSNNVHVQKWSTPGDLHGFTCLLVCHLCQCAYLQLSSGIHALLASKASRQHIITTGAAVQAARC